MTRHIVLETDTGPSGWAEYALAHERLAAIDAARSEELWRAIRRTAGQKRVTGARCPICNGRRGYSEDPKGRCVRCAKAHREPDRLGLRRLRR